MKEALIARIIPVIFVVAGAILLYVWFSADTAKDITVRLPIAENLPKVMPQQLF
jgi:hypothetical protein